jgi:hypothetical protein
MASSPFGDCRPILRNPKNPRIFVTISTLRRQQVRSLWIISLCLPGACAGFFAELFDLILRRPRPGPAAIEREG